MPIVANSDTRKRLSELVKGTSKFQDEAGVNFFYAMVDVKGTALVDPIGTPLVWNTLTSSFNVYVDQDFSAMADSPLPDKTPICITVGDHRGKGFSINDIQLVADEATKFTVLFRGDAAVSEAGIDWDAGSAADDKTAFTTKLEQQRITVVDDAATVNPVYVS